jgi:hypothetical protein
VNDQVYDSSLTPVMLILSDMDKLNIANMLPECTKFASYPATMKDDAVKEFMDIGTITPYSRSKTA